MYSTDTILILGNPRCGAKSLARFFGAARLPVPEWALPSEVLPSYGGRMRLLPVRRTLERFWSAVRYDFREQGRSAEDNPEVACLEVLERLQDSIPRLYLPQVRWACMATLLPLHQFANFAAGSLNAGRLNPGNNYAHAPLAVSRETRQRVLKFYAEDEEWFATTPVWPSVPGTVYLLTGRCGKCSSAHVKTIQKISPRGAFGGDRHAESDGGACPPGGGDGLEGSKIH